MEIHVKLEALAVLDLEKKGGEGLSLRGIRCCLATVIFVAGVIGSATGDVPLIIPVAVDVAANTAVAGVRLPVLPP